MLFHVFGPPWYEIATCFIYNKGVHLQGMDEREQIVPECKLGLLFASVDQYPFKVLIVNSILSETVDIKYIQ